MKANHYYYRPAQFMDEREYTQRMVGAILASSVLSGVLTLSVALIVLL